jgi:hypothetical protein
MKVSPPATKMQRVEQVLSGAVVPEVPAPAPAPDPPTTPQPHQFFGGPLDGVVYDRQGRCVLDKPDPPGSCPLLIAILRPQTLDQAVTWGELIVQRTDRPAPSTQSAAAYTRRLGTRTWDFVPPEEIDPAVRGGWKQ